MRGGNNVLERVFYRSAFASLRNAPESRTFYDRKRAEGKRHTQALIALARRRVNVLWAKLRDGTTFETRSVARHFHRDSSMHLGESEGMEHQGLYSLLCCLVVRPILCARRVPRTPLDEAL
jgi:hypothetical protein